MFDFLEEYQEDQCKKPGPTDYNQRFVPENNFSYVLISQKITFHHKEIQHTMLFADKEARYKAWCSGAEKKVLKNQLHKVNLSKCTGRSIFFFKP